MFRLFLVYLRRSCLFQLLAVGYVLFHNSYKKFKARKTMRALQANKKRKAHKARRKMKTPKARKKKRNAPKTRKKN